MSSTEPRPVGALLGKSIDQILHEQHADPDELAAIAARDAAATADEDHRRRVVADEVRAIEEWRKRIPPRFQYARCADFVDRDELPHVELVRWYEYGEDERQNVVILGPVGVGKTHLAIALAYERHKRGEWVRFWPVVELLDALRPGSTVDPADVAAAAQCKLLVLDDLGAERPTDWTMERLYALINRRWLDELPTIVTSNLEPDTLRVAIGERLYSRLAHDALAVRLSGSDQRSAR